MRRHNGWFLGVLAAAGVLAACSSQVGSTSSETVDDVATKGFEEGVATSRTTETGISSSLEAADGTVLASVTWERATSTFDWTMNDEGGKNVSGYGSLSGATPDVQNNLVHTLWTHQPQTTKAECVVIIETNSPSCLSGVQCCPNASGAITGCTEFRYGAC